jgi:L-rhamnose mutarotase
VWSSFKEKNVKTFGMTINLKDDSRLIEKYKEYHQNVWQETENALKTVGITSMKIFLLGRRMFMYMETVDSFVPERDFPKYLEQHPRCKEWDDLMRTFQEKVPEAQEDEWWAVMEQVYDLK